MGIQEKKRGDDQACLSQCLQNEEPETRPTSMWAHCDQGGGESGEKGRGEERARQTVRCVSALIPREAVEGNGIVLSIVHGERRKKKEGLRSISSFPRNLGHKRREPTLRRREEKVGGKGNASTAVV